jgi:hypothetical protein
MRVQAIGISESLIVQDRWADEFFFPQNRKPPQNGEKEGKFDV